MTATGRNRRTLRIDDPVGPGGVAAANRPGGSAPTRRLRELSIAEIRPNPNQPRKHFDDESLAALAESIRERGVIQPVIVRPRPDGGDLVGDYYRKRDLERQTRRLVAQLERLGHRVTLESLPEAA